MFPTTLRHSRRSSSPRRATYRPRLEALEDRTAPAVLTVNSTADTANATDPYLSLREAIAVANSPTLPSGLSAGITNQISGTLHDGGSDTIRFNIGTGGPQTIAPAVALPEVSTTVTIDGTTQPGYAGTPIIELSGAGAGGANGLVFTGGNSNLRGLVVNRFAGFGIFLTSNNNTVTGCYIGTDITGTQALGNLSGGISVGISVGDLDYNISGNTIGGTAPGQGNVISGNGPTIYQGHPLLETPAGVLLSGHNNVVEGNLIGLTADGNAGLGNGAWPDVLVIAGTNTIGGSSPGARNVISGSARYGILVDAHFDPTMQCVIQGNYIGTDITGTRALRNGSDPLDNGDGVILTGGATGTLVKHNLISGNIRYGITATVGSDGTVIADNYIGTDATGMLALSNLDGGIQIQSSNTLVAGNIISANGGFGVWIGSRGPAQGNRLQGNLIGTDATGQPVLGNHVIDPPPSASVQPDYADRGDGVLISDAANPVGGSAAGAGNLIAGNTGNGVSMLHGSGRTAESDPIYANRVQGNSIYANGGLGIDLGDDGVNANAANDAANHSGPNALMNFPVLTAVFSSPTGTTVSGTLDMNTVGGPYPAGTSITLDFYANAAPDPTGYGQGQTWLGSYPLSADGTASMSFPAISLAALPAGQGYLTATATDADGNTSEFGLDMAVPSASAGGPYTMTYGGSLTLSATGSDPDGEPLSYSWTINGHAGAASGASPTLTWAQLKALGVTAALPFSVSVTADDGHGATAASASEPVTVNPAPLKVMANDSLMLVESNPPPLTGSVNNTPFTSPFQYTTPFGDTVTITLSTTATSTSPVGQYAITPSVSSANYVIDPATSTVGTMYVVSLGADPNSTTGAQAVSFWDNNHNARLITQADLMSLDGLNLVDQHGNPFDPKAVSSLRQWLQTPTNATASYQLSAQLAAMDLNVLTGYVQNTDLVYTGALLPYATTYGIAGLTSGGFIDVQSLMSAANAELGADPRALAGDPNQPYEAALAQVLQAANANTDFVQQELAWGLIGLYLQGGL
jgi:hypothetical protein